MEKVEYISKTGNKIYAEYDEEAYYLVKKGEELHLIRRKDGRTIKKFGDETEFIYQINRNNVPNFVTMEYCANDEKKIGDRSFYLRHYIDYRTSKALFLHNEFKTSVSDRNAKVSDHSFVIGKPGRYQIYNMSGLSRYYGNVYTDEKLRDLVGEGNILVSDRISASPKSELYDVITYGVNPDSFKVVTPVRSRLQDRSFVVEKINDEETSRDAFERVLNSKIVSELKKLDYYLYDQNQVYNYDGSINEDFVGSFKR